jgi:LemA protein
VQQFPASAFAGVFGFQPRTYFDVGPDRAAVESAPQVKF